MGNATESTLPHGNTSGYDRKACRTCACSTCYEQEFCDRCSSCQNQSRKLDRCNAYEGHILLTSTYPYLLQNNKQWMGISL